MAYLITTIHPKTGKYLKRGEEIWLDSARIAADELARKGGIPVTILQVRSRGGNPKEIETRHPAPVLPTPAA